MEKYLTRGGVCYNLAVSPYVYRLDNNEQKLNLHFSSQFHLDKYIENIKRHKIALSESLSNRFNFTIEADLIACLSLYIRCENRGFYIEVINPDGRGVVECQDNLILSGGLVMLPS